MIQLILYLLLAVVCIPIALFLVAFVFLIAMTLIGGLLSLPFDWFKRK